MILPKIPEILCFIHSACRPAFFHCNREPVKRLSAGYSSENRKCFGGEPEPALTAKLLAFANQRLVKHSLPPKRIFLLPTDSPRESVWNNANFLFDSGESYEDNILTLIRKLFTSATKSPKRTGPARWKREIASKIKALSPGGTDRFGFTTSLSQASQ
jgi:hypothetical protein